MAPYSILPPPSLPTAEHFCLRRRQLWFYWRLPQAGALESLHITQELTMLSPITPSRSFTTSLDNLQTIHQLSSPSRTYKTDVTAFQPPTTSTPRDASSVRSATSINDYWELPAYSRIFRRPAHVRESLPPFFRRISTSPSYRCTTAARGSPTSPRSTLTLPDERSAMRKTSPPLNSHSPSISHSLCILYVWVPFTLFAFSAAQTL
ncbi:hypothetical protein P692DRAFT_20875796 [Suillus brevipes Sb2]|nr:hypothetical protein P692DRAFT_20875796 [Suillus brevipes Sb2]